MIDHEPLFADVIRVRNRDREWVTEDGGSLPKADSMFAAVRGFLLRIPLKSKSLHAPSSLTNSEPK